jgi:uncharacterized small protein (DUF1192 family)
MDWDEVRQPAKATVVVGEDLTILSIAELSARVAMLQGEITRIEGAIATKQRQTAAADALFRSPQSK